MIQTCLEFERTPSREDRFWKFHRDNPHVYRLLVKYARELKAAGHAKAGIRLLWERMRWDWLVSTTEQGPVFNDHYPPFYSRLIMETESDLIGFFEIRGKQKTLSKITSCHDAANET